MNVDDFRPLGKLSGAYELQRGKLYLFVFEGKDFSYDHAHSLLAKLREDGVEFDIHIIATSKPKSIEVRESDEPIQS